MDYKKEPVKGYEEYQVDTNGIVYGKNGKPLKYSLNHKGYCIINFYINGQIKGFAIHTLVAKQFIPNNDPSKWQVNHKDGNKENNNISNLEWVTPEENIKHSKEVLGNNNLGVNSSQAKPIKGVSKKDGTEIYFDAMSDGARFLAREHNIKFIHAKCSLWRALSGCRKSYKGYYWQYV